MMFAVHGCAHPSAPAQHAAPLSDRPITRAGSAYRVQPGDTLWGIGHDFGIDSVTLARVNRLSDPTTIEKDQILFVPLPPNTEAFLWPARGSIQPLTDDVGESRRTTALVIDAPPGSDVRAAQRGRIAVATRELLGYGQTLIIDHGNGYLTVYGRLQQIFVPSGMNVAQGLPIGQLGHAPLYFEIRHGAYALDPLTLLP